MHTDTEKGSPSLFEDTRRILLANRRKNESIIKANTVGERSKGWKDHFTKVKIVSEQDRENNKVVLIKLRHKMNADGEQERIKGSLYEERTQSEYISYE